LDRKIILAGATGLIGKNLISLLFKKGDKIVVFTRNIESAKRSLENDSIEYVNWDYGKSPDEIIHYLEGSFAIYNLAGASIAGKRWSDKYKKVLYDSRIITTRKITEAISKCKNKPGVLINSSAIGYYGTTGKDVLNEESIVGSDYLASLCRDWENAAYEAEKSGVRVVTLRTGIVLDKNEGALKKFLLPFKLFIGGKHGTGNQWFSWIHIDDLINLMIFSLENENVKGGVNCTSPYPVINKEFCKILGHVMHRPSFFPVPGFILKIVVGDFAEYLLKGRKVIPEKAIKNGFIFKYEDLDKALNNLLNTR
jgi:uncharacterized protein